MVDKGALPEMAIILSGALHPLIFTDRPRADSITFFFLYESSYTTLKQSEHASLPNSCIIEELLRKLFNSTEN